MPETKASKKRRLEAKLDVRKRKAALLLVENELNEYGERRTQEEIASEIGITRKCLWQWKTQDSVFIEYTNMLADEFLDAKRTIVYRQLMKLIDCGQPSVKAIDLFLRRHGLLTDKQVVETNEVSTEKSNEDIEKDLAELDKIINEDNEE